MVDEHVSSLLAVLVDEQVEIIDVGQHERAAVLPEFAHDKRIERMV